MNEILESGVQVVSNQVQFSLIDLRPTFKMAESCLKHKVKLLTYGSLVRCLGPEMSKVAYSCSVVDFWPRNGLTNLLRVSLIRR